MGTALRRGISHYKPLGEIPISDVGLVVRPRRLGRLAQLRDTFSRVAAYWVAETLTP